MKKLSIDISRYFFLLFFLGFFGSNTFFNHIHVVDGITIVHSHPYKSDSNGLPKHSHTDKGYITIQLLSSIVVASLLTCTLILLIFPFIGELIAKTREGNVNHFLLHLYSLRAPPSYRFK